MYRLSVAKASKEKAATFGFEVKSFKTLEEVMVAVQTYATIPARVRKGKRDYASVSRIYPWVRFDCDMPGEKETITGILDEHNIEYIAVPSTNYHEKFKSYKWHIHVPVKGVAKEINAYKWQVMDLMTRLNIQIHDDRLTKVIVQNANPYAEGAEDSPAYVHKGNTVKLSKPPEDIKEWTIMEKVKGAHIGSAAPIPKRVAETRGGLIRLEPHSGIELKDIGWITLDDLAMEPGEMVSGLSCPGHNTAHSDGRGAPGYAFASMDEAGDVHIHCSGAECKGKHYMMVKENFNAETKLSDLYELRRIVSVMGFDFKGNSYYLDQVYFREGDLREFIGDDILFKHPITKNKKQIKKVKKLEKQLAVTQGAKEQGVILADIQMIEDQVFQSVVRDAMGDRADWFLNKYSSRNEYIFAILNSIIRYVKTKNQYDTVWYEVDPFGKDDGEFRNREMILYSSDMGIDKPKPTQPDSKYVDDYLQHNPYLHDILDMIMSQRFGADRKSSFLWLQADSDWGKSFLFEGMMKGFAFTVTLDEIKKAMKGDPSGLNPSELAKSSMLFVDEFNGAIRELKNITYEVAITPKGKSKAVVPVYMKIFASAEDVPSLVGEGGVMEAQYRNRFLKIEAHGSMRNRPVYMNNKHAYGEAVRQHIHAYLWDQMQTYMQLGKDAAAAAADKRYEELIQKYSISKNTVTIEDEAPSMASEWVDAYTRYLAPGTWDEHNVFYKTTTGKLYVRSLGRLKDLYIREEISEDQQKVFKHKNARHIFGGIIAENVGGFKVDGATRRGYKITLK